MGFLDTWILLGISGTVIFVFAILVLAYLLYSNKDEQGEKAESNRKVMAGILVVLIVAVFLSASGYSFAPAPVTVTGANSLAGQLTMAITATGSCYAFTAPTFSLACNKVVGSYVALTTNNGTNGGLSGASISAVALSKYSANTLYLPGGGTTNNNEYSISFTLRRTDVGFTDPSCAGYCNAAVKASFSSLQGVGITSNVSTQNSASVPLLTKDVYGNYQEGWTDTNSNTQVGLENANGIMSLAPNGGSNTIKFAFVLNQIGLPRNIPFTTTIFTGSFVISMSFATTSSGTSATPVTWTIPFTLTLTSVA